MSNSLVKKEELGLGFAAAPSSQEEALEWCERYASSGLCPKVFAGKPNDVFIAACMGHALGLNPIAATQNIAVINGRASLWGDAMKAVVLNSGLVEDFVETWDEKAQAYTCTITRKGMRPHSQTYSMKDADIALLSTKDIWKKNPRRMLQMRARSFCIRDVFPDIISGLIAAEEAMDYHVDDSTSKPPKKEIKTLTQVLEPVETKAPVEVIEPEIVVEAESVIENTPALDTVALINEVSSAPSVLVLKEVAKKCAKLTSEEDKGRVREAYKNRLQELKDAEPKWTLEGNYGHNL